MPRTPDASTVIELRSGTDPLLTMRQLWLGPLDRQMQLGHNTLSRAARTPAGPATLELHVAGRRVEAQAWGSGAGHLLGLLPGLMGELDDPSALRPRHPIVAQLLHRLPGLRMTRGTSVMETLVPAIVGQKVTSFEARRAYAALVMRYGEAAPGPFGLLLPPAPELLARLPYWAYHPLGIERRRADAIRAAGSAAERLEEAARMSPGRAVARLLALPGIGPWTAAETLRLVLGDPDAVSVGDFNLPRLVCSVLAGESDGDDERMLELLSPYAGQRARVVLLIENSGLRPPRHAPRPTVRSIATM